MAGCVVETPLTTMAVVMPTFACIPAIIARYSVTRLTLLLLFLLMTFSPPFLSGTRGVRASQLAIARPFTLWTGLGRRAGRRGRRDRPAAKIGGGCG